MEDEPPPSKMENVIPEAIKAQFMDTAAPPPEICDVYCLRLEYKRIKCIEGLWDFTSLTELDLNNNFIEKILGLDHLINLKKLNLSFNSIKKIEGLECLQELKSLNLSNNKISVIENLDTIKDLTHFFFANNLLEDLDNVLYLRKFKNIFTINLFGNPAADDDNYEYFMAAFFPNLGFMDFKIPDENTKTEACYKYKNILDQMKSEELERKRAEETRRIQDAELKLHKAAFVEFLNGSYLFESMFENDPETDTLHRCPGVDSLLEMLETQMVALCTQLFEMGLAEYERREAELNDFHSGMNEVTCYQKQQSQIVETFDQEHKKRIFELQQLSDPDAVPVKISQCKDEIHHQYKSLMNLQFEHVRQVKKNVKEFDNNITEMVANFIEAVEGIFVHCRDLEGEYHRKVQDAAMDTLVKVAEETQDEDMPDDVIMLFSDKDAVMDILTTCHDNHVVKINDRETQLVAGINTWKQALIKEIQDKELYLHRSDILDFVKQRDNLLEQLEDFQ